MTRRILHVVGDSGFGGGSRVVMALAAGARAVGHDASVLTTDRSFLAALADRDIPAVPLDVIRQPTRPSADLAGAVRLRRWLHRSDVDLVHTHTSKAGVVGRWAAHTAGTPVVVHTAHGFAFHETSPARTIRAYAAVERLADRWCDATVTVSEFHRRWAVELGIARPDHVRAIANGIDPVRIRPAGDVAHRRRAIGAGPGDVVVVAAGRLAAGKGLETLVKAVGRARSRVPGLRLVLVGEGDLAPALQRLVDELGLGDVVHLAGFTEDVGTWLAAADIAALPSLREGMSIAVLEAMAAGRALVASTISSNREVTDDGRVAELVPAGDVGALVGALVRLAEDPERRARLGRAGRERFDGAYDEQVMVAAYLALYDELLARADQVRGTSRRASRRWPAPRNRATSDRVGSPK